MFGCVKHQWGPFGSQRIGAPEKDGNVYLLEGGVWNVVRCQLKGVASTFPPTFWSLQFMFFFCIYTCGFVAQQSVRGYCWCESPANRNVIGRTRMPAAPRATEPTPIPLFFVYLIHTLQWGFANLNVRFGWQYNPRGFLWMANRLPPREDKPEKTDLF